MTKQKKNFHPQQGTDVKEKEVYKKIFFLAGLFDTLLKVTA